jgi:hypothetical protein
MYSDIFLFSRILWANHSIAGRIAFFCLFAYYLCNEAFSSSDCIALNYRTISP